jgi:integration host factor subunit alpha
MATITKAEIVGSLCRELGIHVYQSKDIVDDFFEEIRRQLESGVEVKMSGFGNFCLRDKVARPGRNPKTGNEVIISPRRVVTFKAGQKLKDIIT